MSSYVKRVGDLTEPVELSASQVTEKMTSTVDTWFDPVTKPAHYAGHTGIECKQAMESMLGIDEYVSYMQGCVCSGSATHVRAASHMSVSFGAGKAWRAKTSNGISTSSCGSITAMCG